MMLKKITTAAIASNRKLIDRLKSDAADVHWPMTVISSTVQTVWVVTLSMGLGCLAVDAAILGMMTSHDPVTVQMQISPEQFTRHLADTLTWKAVLGVFFLVFGVLIGGVNLTRVWRKRSTLLTATRLRADISQDAVR